MKKILRFAQNDTDAAVFPQNDTDVAVFPQNDTDVAVFPQNNTDSAVFSQYRFYKKTMLMGQIHIVASTLDHRLAEVHLVYEDDIALHSV